MSFTTVGEIIDALAQFDRSLPVVKSDNTGVGYYDVSLVGGMSFRIVPDGGKAGFPYYRDADAKEAAGFDAVVL